MIRGLLRFYFAEESKEGLSAYRIKPPELKGQAPYDLLTRRLLKKSDVAKCFDVFGKYKDTVKLALYLLVVDNLSPTEIAWRLRRRNCLWKRAINPKNIYADLREMETGVENEAIKRGLLEAGTT
ncbi:MAG: hypothetical protein Kow0090_19530 [Myxococcota bacterium]